jgi:acetyl esterase/lipase
LTGDSAGGYLVVLVTIMAIQRGIRVPDSIFLTYPSVDLDPRRFYPSRLLNLDDDVISYAV